MSASIVIDWQRSPPALGLALSRGQHRFHSVENSDAIRGCIRPALAATTPAGFVREVSRRLPLFAALHARELGQVDAWEHHATDPAAVTQGYAALGAELMSWGDRLDEVAQAELDVAISTLQRSNETLLQAAPESKAAETADLFRATILVEFLLLCLWNLVESGEHPQIADQIVYSLRYAALDHAASVRRSTSRPPQPASPSPEADPDGAEDSFWALAGALPLLEVGAAA